MKLRKRTQGDRQVSEGFNVIPGVVTAPSFLGPQQFRNFLVSSFNLVP